MRIEHSPDKQWEPLCGSLWTNGTADKLPCPIGQRLIRLLITINFDSSLIWRFEECVWLSWVNKNVASSKQNHNSRLWVGARSSQSVIGNNRGQAQKCATTNKTCDCQMLFLIFMYKFNFLIMSAVRVPMRKLMVLSSDVCVYVCLKRNHGGA